MKTSKATAKQLTDSRLKYQNPYAHLTGAGGFEGVVVASAAKVQNRYVGIEHKVRELQLDIWARRDELWPEGAPTDPVQLLDPSKAIQSIGFEYDLVADLGEFRYRGSTSKVAGIINRSAKRISISNALDSSIQRFTAAHELAHALLHREAVMHRDRPLDGSGRTREKMEIEADKFASCFLMPEKLVRERFEKAFGVKGVFVVTDDMAFALDSADPEGLINRCKTPRNLSRVLAKAEQFNGRHMYSLAAQFGVSIEAMAIRIEELKLVEI